MLQVFERTVAGLFVLADSKKILRHLVDGEYQRASFEVHLNFGDFHQIIADSRRWLSFQGVVAEESFVDVLELGNKRTGLFHKRFSAHDKFVKNFRAEKTVFSVTNTNLVADKLPQLRV